LQAERLAELSTPVIRFGRGVAIMPLIGTLDDERALDIRERALTRAHQHGVRVLLLDLTGLRDVSRAAVEGLLSTVRALRMIGTQVIINGIGPELALALIEANVELGQLAISTTLDDGLAMAMKGQTIVRAAR
jgi:anti-anti-sigma regulatory factor